MQYIMDLPDHFQTIGTYITKKIEFIHSYLANHTSFIFSCRLNLDYLGAGSIDKLCHHITRIICSRHNYHFRPRSFIQQKSGKSDGRWTAVSQSHATHAQFEEIMPRTIKQVIIYTERYWLVTFPFPLRYSDFLLVFSN